MDRSGPLLEIVLVVDHRTPDVRGAVDAVRRHLGARLPPGSWTLTVADESTPSGRATAGLDGDHVVVSGRALTPAERRLRWAGSSADVVSFVAAGHPAGGDAFRDGLESLLAPLVSHATPRVTLPAAAPPLPVARPAAPAVGEVQGGRVALLLGGRLSRRRTLLALGGAGLTGLLAACSRGGSSATSSPDTTSASTGTGDSGTGDTAGGDPATESTPAATSSAGTSSTTGAATTTATTCELTPKMTEGPYYLDLDLVRRDVTEGKEGAALPLTLTVVDSGTCAPLEGAAVDIWHCDALGAYSGFAQGGGGQGTTFLRGTQITGADGRVTFDTIYPGWYRGRTVHIHIKVHVSGRTVLTGQLFFDEAVTDAVYETEPYAQRPGRDTSNEADRIYQGGGARSTLTVVPQDGAYPAAMTVGVTVGVTVA